MFLECSALGATGFLSISVNLYQHCAVQSPKTVKSSAVVTISCTVLACETERSFVTVCLALCCVEMQIRDKGKDRNTVVT